MKKSFYNLLFISMLLLLVSKEGFCQSTSDNETSTQVSSETKSTKPAATTAKKTQSNSPIAIKVCELLEKEQGYPSFVSTDNKEQDDEKYSEAKNDWISKHPERYRFLCQEAMSIVNEATK